MKKKIFIMLVMGFFLTGISCEKKSGDEPDHTATLDQISDELIESGNMFSLELFQHVVKNDHETDNIFISPLSVSIALAMAYNGSASDTKLEFEEILGFEGLSTEEINGSYQDLMKALIDLDERVLLNIANSVWSKEGFEVEKVFLDINKNYYDAEVRSLDFGRSDAVDIINGWIDEKTNHKIEEVLDYIPSSAVMYLINAIYFKGTWKYAFDEEKTIDKTFFLSSGDTKQVPMMVQEASFAYLSNDLFQAVELPYGEGDFSMMVLLPKDDKTTGMIVNEMSEDNWDTWISSLKKEEEVQVELPKFKFMYGTRLLNDELTEMGLVRAFSPGADFSKINPVRDIFISRVLHKAFVEVNEQGTEAAAVTVVEFVETSVPSEPDKIYFRVNKPFLFVIREKNTNAILFMGKIMEPMLD